MAWTLQVGSRLLEFGGSLSGLGLMEEPSVRPILAGDWSPNPRRDGRRFGPQHRVGQVVTLSVEARPDVRSLDEVWRELLAVWRADEVRTTPGALASLIAPSGRRAYGRPGELDPSLKQRLFDSGHISLKFEGVDDLWFGPLEATRVRFSVPETGGLTFPAEAPFTFDSGPTQRNGVVVVPGDVAMLPTFVIQGPVVNPAVTVTGVGTVIFDATLAHDQALTVNCADGWVMRDGVPMPGALSPRGARLSDMSLSPGSYEVILRGYDPTGTGYLDVQVEPAYTSY